jgi:hypothetical protein
MRGNADDEERKAFSGGAGRIIQEEGGMTITRRRKPRIHLARMRNAGRAFSDVRDFTRRAAAADEAVFHRQSAAGRIRSKERCQCQVATHSVDGAIASGCNI